MVRSMANYRQKSILHYDNWVVTPDSARRAMSSTKAKSWGRWPIIWIVIISVTEEKYNTNETDNI